MKVDDVDPNGKVSLSLAGAVEIPDSAVSSGGGDRGGDRERAARDRAARRAAPAGAGDRESVSFEDAFDAEVRQEFGDLGPAATAARPVVVVAASVAAAVAAAASVAAVAAVVADPHGLG